MNRSCLGFALIATITLGCSEKKEAMLTFAAKHSCPEDSIKVTLASGPSFSERYRALHPQMPPVEVAASPERLIVWKKQRDTDTKWTEEFTVYTVTGCSHTDEFACYCPGFFTHDQRSMMPQDRCSCDELGLVTRFHMIPHEKVTMGFVP